MNAKNRTPLVLVAVLAVLALIAMAGWEQAVAQREAGPGPVPRYSVVETEGHNLIVTDNQKSTLYFYTIDQGKEIGSELKLRGTVDLSQVGKPVIKPATVKAGQ